MSCEEGITDRINFDIKRGKHFQSIAQLVYCCHGLPYQLTPTKPKLEAFLNEEEGPSKEFIAAITKVVNELMEIASATKWNKAFRAIPQRVAPIEFVFIGMSSLSSLT